MESVQKIDEFITRFLSHLFPHTPFFDSFFSFLSLRGDSIALWIGAIILLILIGEKRDKKFIVYFLVSFLTTALLVNVVLKNIVQRPRPQLSSNSCPSDFSFPSGHAATAFAAAATLGFFDRKRRWAYYLLAVMISFSRIYLGCHYLFDTVGGGVIGYVIARAVLRIKKKRNPPLV